jgi:hypothetical protein
MQEIINCPGCQRKLQIPEELLGKDVQCPTCGHTFQAALEMPATPRPEADAPEYRERPREAPLTRSKRRRRYEDEDDYDDDGGRIRRRRRDLEPHRGNMILVLGILSIVLGFVGLVLGPIAWVMGNQDMAEIKAGRMDPDGESSTNAGRVCGIIGTILHICGVALCCVWFGVWTAFFGAMRGNFR